MNKDTERKKQLRITIIMTEKEKDRNSLTNFVSEGFVIFSWSSHEQRKEPREIWQQGKPFEKDTL